MRRPRLRTIGLVTIAVLLVAVAILLVALPSIVRRVAVDRLGRLTGRAVALERVELNVFTGRLALARFRLAQRDRAEAALEFERLEARVALTSLLSRNIRVAGVTLTAPAIRVARLGPDAYDFSDLLALIPPADPKQPPSTTAVTVERLAVTGGTIVARDEVTSPPSAWRLEDFTVEGSGITTRAGAPPGRITVRTKMNGAPVAITVSSLDAAAGALSGRIAVDGFDLAAVGPYVPETVAVTPGRGHLSADLAVSAQRVGGVMRVTLGGDAGVKALVLLERGNPTPFLTVDRVGVKIKEAAPLERVVALEAVELQGVGLRSVRDAQGRIDLLALAGGAAAAPTTPLGAARVAARAPSAPVVMPPPAPSTPAAAPPTAPAAATAFRVTVDRIALRGATATFRDEAVKPAATLVLADISADVRDLAWPAATAPLGFEVTLRMPGAGTLGVKGTATLAPVTADFAMTLRNAPINPYQAYFPIPARLSGTFNGDSTNHLSLADGRFRTTSKGRSWIERLEVRAPGQTTPAARVERLEIAGIDFAFPERANAAKVTVTKPDIKIERDAAGALDLRQLFTPADAGKPAQPPPAPVAAVTPAATPPPPMATAATPAPHPAGAGALPLAVDLGVIVVEDGSLRFLDRTTKPPFSETISRLAITVNGLSSTPGRRAKIAVQAVVGADAALDLKGEIAPLGELYVDLTGELRDFTMASANPYADNAIAWIFQRGKLAARVHYRIEKGQLTAENEIVVANLQVEPSRAEDEVKKRLGVPLGLIVALVTDANNGIRVNVPLSGGLSTWSVDFSEAIWAAVKNVAVNVLAAPFRAIGRLFTKGDKIDALSVAPVTFPAGSNVIEPDMGRHLTAVADFLRRSPAIALTLKPVTTAGDLDTLRGQELTARLQALQREAKLAEFPAAVAADFHRRFPDVTPLPPPEQQLARLRAVEPVPAERVTELTARRVAAIREGLTTTEGIPAGRLRPGEGPATPSAEGAGRVEFEIAY